MNIALRSTLLVLATAGVLPAQAAIQNWSFSGTLESGAYAGATFSGSARFDDAALTGIGEEWIKLDAIDLTFLGKSYSMIDAAAMPEAAFLDGAFVGLGYVVEAGDPRFALIAGFASLSVPTLPMTLPRASPVPVPSTLRRPYRSRGAGRSCWPASSVWPAPRGASAAERRAAQMACVVVRARISAR